MTVKWRHCVIADRDHRENVRNYAHTYHYPNTICLAEAFWELPRQYRHGILLHEVGHLIAGPHGSEDEANEAAYEWSGARIQYVDSPYGRHLERLGNMAGARIISQRRNPLHHGHELPYDQWVPSHAVKFNSDGTVDVMTEAEHAARNVSAGMTIGTGKRRKFIPFHSYEGVPTEDYDPEFDRIYREAHAAGSRKTRRNKPAAKKTAAKKRRR